MSRARGFRHVFGGVGIYSRHAFLEPLDGGANREFVTELFDQPEARVAQRAADFEHHCDLGARRHLVVQRFDLPVQRGRTANDPSDLVRARDSHDFRPGIGLHAFYECRAHTINDSVCNQRCEYLSTQAVSG